MLPVSAAFKDGDIFAPYVISVFASLLSKRHQRSCCLWLPMQDSIKRNHAFPLQQVLVNMHLRFCLSMVAHAGLHQHVHLATPSQPDQVCSRVTHSDLPSDGYSLRLRSSWTAFYLSASKSAHEQLWEAPPVPPQSKGSESAGKAPAPSSMSGAQASVASQAGKPVDCSPQFTALPATATPAQSGKQQQHSPEHASQAAAEQAERGLPRYHSCSLQLICLSGLQALINSNDSWAEVEPETYQACVSAFALTALNCKSMPVVGTGLSLMFQLYSHKSCSCVSCCTMSWICE